MMPLSKKFFTIFISSRLYIGELGNFRSYFFMVTQRYAVSYSIICARYFFICFNDDLYRFTYIWLHMIPFFDFAIFNTYPLPKSYTTLVPPAPMYFFPFIFLFMYSSILIKAASPIQVMTSQLSNLRILASTYSMSRTTT
jgi:hypothetical protein